MNNPEKFLEVIARAIGMQVIPTEMTLNDTNIVLDNYQVSEKPFFSLLPCSGQFTFGKLRNQVNYKVEARFLFFEQAFSKIEKISELRRYVANFLWSVSENLPQSNYILQAGTHEVVTQFSDSEMFGLVVTFEMPFAIQLQDCECIKINDCDWK